MSQTISRRRTLAGMGAGAATVAIFDWVDGIVGR